MHLLAFRYNDLEQREQVDATASLNIDPYITSARRFKFRQMHGLTR